MLDVHPPHQAAHTWKDFFIHIATIVIGLLIAIGLEQTVEAIHHHHQRSQLEEQLLDVLYNNLAIDAFDLQQLGAFRGYLVDLQATVVAHRNGKAQASAHRVDDPRMKMAPRFPSLAPYEAAQQNGTVAVLPSGEIRLYNRVALQRELLRTESQNWFRAINAWESFNQRFVDSTGSAEFGGISRAPDLDGLSPAELIEYQTLLANLTKQTDVVAERFHYFDTECRSILRGIRDENALMDDISHQRPADQKPVSPP